MTGSLASAKTVKAFSQVAKIVAYIVTFLILLTGAVAAKGSMLFMTSQIKLTNGKPDVQHEYCSKRKIQNELIQFNKTRKFKKKH